MQFLYGGPLEESHIVQTNPLTIAPLEQLLELNERHPSDVVFLPDVNHEDAGYIFVTHEYDQRRVAVYQWEPGSQFNNLGTVFAGLPNNGPAFVFLEPGRRHLLSGHSRHAGYMRCVPSSGEGVVSDMQKRRN